MAYTVYHPVNMQTRESILVHKTYFQKYYDSWTFRTAFFSFSYFRSRADRYCFSLRTRRQPLIWWKQKCTASARRNLLDTFENRLKCYILATLATFRLARTYQMPLHVSIRSQPSRSPIQTRHTLRVCRNSNKRGRGVSFDSMLIRRVYSKLAPFEKKLVAWGRPSFLTKCLDLTYSSLIRSEIF